MAKIVKGVYFDGKTSASHSATLRLHGGGTIAIDPILFASTSIDQVKATSRIGNVPRSILLPNGGRFETDNHDAIDIWLAHLKQPKNIIYALESKASIALGALAFIIFFTIACITWGIPALSKMIADELPYSASQYISEEAFESMDLYLFDDTNINKVRRESLTTQFSRLTSKLENGEKYQLLFRHSKAIGANAFALPNGTVVVTDDLIEMAEDDEEILAILLHEIGHVEHRHSLRQIFDQTGIAAVSSLLLGDISSGGALILGLPNVLLNSSYSRDMEWEADTYAFEQMKVLKISTQHFSNIMERMASEYEELDTQTNFDFYDYISTHPATEDRISRFYDSNRKEKLAALKTPKNIAVNLETKYPNIFTIRELFENEKFEELDQLLRDYQNEYEQHPGGEIALEMAYETLGLVDRSYELLFEKWIKAMPNSYVPYLARGGYFYNYSWLERGSKYISKTSEKQLSGMRNYQDRATKDLEKTLELKPSAMLAYSHLIAITSSQSQKDLKARFIINALAIDPASYLVRRDTIIYSQPKWGGSHQLIKKILKETVEYQDQNPELIALQGYPHHLKAIASYSDKKNYKVIKHEYQALKSGGKAWYYEKLADAYYRIKDFESASIAYSNAIELYPYEEEYYYWRGKSYWKLDKQASAIRDMEYAVRINPFYNRAQSYLGWFYAREKQYEKSLAAYQAALYHQPNDRDAQYYIADLLSTLERYSEAKIAITELLEIEPDNTKYQYKYTLILNAQRDCNVLPEMETYISLCDNEGSDGCFEEGIDWAKHMVNVLQESYCKDHITQ